MESATFLVFTTTRARLSPTAAPASRGQLSASAATHAHARRAPPTRAMPPRARTAAAAQPCALFERVPHAILLVIFSLLPVDMRLRCREVCPAWRAVLSAERSLWVRLDLSVSSGLLARRVTPALLRAAAALAGGQLEALNVSDSDNVVAEVLAVAAAGTLRELRSSGGESRSFVSLIDIGLQRAPLHSPAALHAVLDAAQALRVVKLDLRWCSLSPASVPALVRLLNASALTELRVGNGGEPLLDAPAAVLLGAALHASSTLTSLELTGVVLWRDPAAASTLLRALTAHRSLRTLLLRHNDAETERHRRYAGRALGAFVAENTPALTGLYLGASALGDAGLRPLFDALRANTHLRSLFVDGRKWAHAGFRTRLPPAGGAPEHQLARTGRATKLRRHVRRSGPRRAIHAAGGGAG